MPIPMKVFQPIVLLCTFATSHTSSSLEVRLIFSTLIQTPTAGKPPVAQRRRRPNRYRLSAQAEVIANDSPTSYRNNKSHHQQRKVQRNKVNNYFNCKSDDQSDITTPVGCTVTSTNMTTLLDIPGASRSTDDCSPDAHSAPLRHIKLLSELLDLDTQDNTANTTDNHPLDTNFKILNTDQPSQARPTFSTLQILNRPAERTQSQEVVMSDTESTVGLEGVDTRNLETKDPIGRPSAHGDHSNGTRSKKGKSRRAADDGGDTLSQTR